MHQSLQASYDYPDNYELTAAPAKQRGSRVV